MLVALDQRRAARLRRNWIEAAESLLHEPRQVKVLASDRRVGVLRSILRELTNGQGLQQRVQFVPYRNRTVLEALIANARSVITDLDDFSRIAQEAGSYVVELPGRQATGERPTFPHSYWSQVNPVRPPR